MDFVEPLKDLPDFDIRAFRYNITKYKYFELLCIKQEPGPLHDNDFTVEVHVFFSTLQLILVVDTPSVIYYKLHFFRLFNNMLVTFHDQSLKAYSPNKEIVKSLAARC